MTSYNLMLPNLTLRIQTCKLTKIKPVARKTCISFYKIPTCLLFCRRPREVCTFISGNFRSECSQVYNYHRLLTWDDVKGLHMDIFKVRYTEVNTKTIRTTVLDIVLASAVAASSRKKMYLYSVFTNEWCRFKS